MTRTQKLMLVAATVIAGAIVVYVDTRMQGGHEAESISGAVRAVEMRLELAKKPKKAALVTKACEHGGCECAVVAAEQGLDVDAHLEAFGVLTVASRLCASTDKTAALHAEAVARLGDVGRAKAEAAQVIAKNPRDPFGLYAAALASYKAGELPEALASAEQAAAAGRGATAHLLAGLIAYNIGNVDLATSEFRAVLQTEPDDIDALFNLALVAQKQNRYTEAREGYLHIASLDPTYSNARYNLAILAHSVGANDEAQHHLAKFESIAKGDDRLDKLKALLAAPAPEAPPQAAPALSAALGSAPQGAAQQAPPPAATAPHGLVAPPPTVPAASTSK